MDVVPVYCRRHCSVAATLNGMSWVWDIKGALTISVLMQYVLLYQRLQSVHLEPRTRDWLWWRWSADGTYSSCLAYVALLLGQASVLGAKELWKAKAPNSCKFFIVTEPPQKWGICLPRSYWGILDEARMRKHTQISIQDQIWNSS
jgi:hypothetical protein